MRTPIIAGNWKMNNTIADGVALATAIRDGLGDQSGVDVVVCPTATALKSVADAVAGSGIGVGAQNMHDQPSGAFTGEISGDMVRDTGATHVILGHSERRQYFGETDAGVNAKARAAIDLGLVPILCVGETQAERESGDTENVVSTQVRGCLGGFGHSDINRLVVAYEPVWAIGTGLTATPDQAQDVHALIRALVTDLSDADTAGGLRIQYGGSMKPGNAAELLAQPDIDGGLIGGASLDAESFLAIVAAAR